LREVAFNGIDVSAFTNPLNTFDRNEQSSIFLHKKLSYYSYRVFW